MSISWVKHWNTSDDGTTLRAIDLRNIQDDIDTGINDMPSKTSTNIFSSSNTFQGVTRFGSDTDNATFAVDGSLTLSGAATMWSGMQISLTSGKQGSTSKPDFDYTNNGYLFPQNDATEIVYASCRLPNSWKIGSSIHPHIHWQQSAATGVVWKLDYKWFNLGDAVPAAWTTITLATTSYTYVSGNLNQVSSSAAVIDGTGKTLSSVMLLKLYRDDNTTTGDVLAYQLDIQFEMDSLGSRTEYVK